MKTASDPMTTTQPALSDENRAIVGRDRKVYTITAEDLNAYLNAAREEGFRQGVNQDSPMWQAEHKRIAELGGQPVSLLSVLSHPNKKDFQP